jgi:hypothetical protein
VRGLPWMGRRRGPHLTGSAEPALMSGPDDPANGRARDRADRPARQHIAERAAGRGADCRVLLRAAHRRTAGQARHQQGDGGNFDERRNLHNRCADENERRRGEVASTQYAGRIVKERHRRGQSVLPLVTARNTWRCRAAGVRSMCSRFAGSMPSTNPRHPADPPRNSPGSRRPSAASGRTTRPLGRMIESPRARPVYFPPTFRRSPTFA